MAEPVYELSVLQLSTADRQRLYEVIQGSSAFPCTRESVKGLSADLLNKARKLLQHSRRPTETTAPKDYLLTHDNKLVGSFEPIKKARYEPQRFQEPRQAPPARMPEKPAMRYPEPRFESRYTPEPRFNSDSHFPNDNNPPAYLPYTPLQTVAPSHDRNMMQPHSLTPEQMQNMTAEQKMQYFYYLNNPSTYYNQYGPY